MSSPKIEPQRKRQQGARYWQGLLGNAALWYVLSDIKNDLHDRPHVLVCAEEDALDRIAEDLQSLMPLMDIQLPVYLIPMRPLPRKGQTHYLDPVSNAQRLARLHALSRNQKAIYLLSVSTFGQSHVPLSLLRTLSMDLKKGQEIDPEVLQQYLLDWGYRREFQVTEVGQFARRGSIIDVFSPNQNQAIRLDFFDIELESLRYFDLESQQSDQEIGQLTLIPASDVILSPELRRDARTEIKRYADERGLPNSKRMHWDAILEEGRRQEDLICMLPALYAQPTFISQGVNQSGAPAQIYIWDPFLSVGAYARFYQTLSEKDWELPSLVSPQDHFLTPDQLKSMFQQQSFTHMSDMVMDVNADTESDERFETESLEALKHGLQFDRSKERPLQKLADFIEAAQRKGQQVVLFAGSEAEAKRLGSFLSSYGQNVCFELTEMDLGKVLIRNTHLSGSAVMPDQRWALISSEELFGRKKKHAPEKAVPRENSFGSIDELEIGQALVHIDFGIARYQGMKRMQLNGGIENDFLELNFDGGDKLFLPVYRLNRIHKYVGADASNPRLDRLGSQSKWQDTKQKAKKAVEEMAQDLIELYAKRQMATKTPYRSPDQMYADFERAFMFEETPDQLKAIVDIAQDLESEKPMDRLVCGDVGFGKTEVALRAVFRTILEGKQSAVLVPTTILCQQHFESFKERLQAFPVKVDFLSRFKPRAEQKKVLAQLDEGELDVVVGTHRLLSKDVTFGNLGLLVLDEEHRFGVKHKEEIKKYRNLVNVLTLTATPIPRTLQLSMAGIRDLSVINTPPIDRKSVQTLLCRQEDALVRDAINKELARQGQVYYLHNRVETIEAQVAYLKSLVPKARIAFGHGQMSESALEKIMLGFITHEFDILVSTTIIESGLDIPKANTMIINRADTFGLAQLYQLRGRVGRSDRQAYCYLLIPSEDALNSDALKRLKALQRFTDLGSGLKIAMHDLEIRGAGNMLGQAQSGHIAHIGFELYTQLLEREVRKLKGEKVEPDIEPEISVAMPTFIPENFVRDHGERLRLYKRLSAARDHDQLASLKNELIDRFGALPQTVVNLLEVIDLKIEAKRAGVTKLAMGTETPVIEFADQAPIDMNILMRLMKENQRIRLTPDQKLILSVDPELQPFEEVKQLLRRLTGTSEA